MSTYFLSKEGSDSNNGLGPDASHATNKPWLNLSKVIGAAGFASGDICIVGPGVYRETPSVAMTSATAETQIIGDPGNAYGFKTSGGVLVAPGDVVCTSYTTNDTTAPAAAAALTLSGRDFLTFQFLTFVGGNNSPSCINATSTNSTNITFRDCKFICGNTANPAITYTGLADVASNWTIERCVILSYGSNGIQLSLPTSSAADYDTNFQIIDCVIEVPGSNAVQVNASGALSFKAGGVDIADCTLVCRLSGIQTNSANLSTSIPCTVTNCVIIAGGGPALNANTSGQITETYNRIISGTPRTNVTAGTGSVSDMSHAPLFELGFAQMTGFRARSFWGPMATSPILGFGSTGSPTVDILNRPRPAGGGATTKAVGAYERHDTAAQETSVTQAGSSAIKIVGPGDHDFQINVDPASTTISIYARYDTTHGTGSKPQVVLLANGAIGVTTQTLTMTAAVDTWEQLTFSAQTPTAKGVVTIRLISRSAGGAGIAYFDTLGVA